MGQSFALNPALLIKEANTALVNERIVSYFGYTMEFFENPVPEEDYDLPNGIQWPANTSQYHKELYAYKQGGMNGHDKAYHMINAIRLDLPNFEFISQPTDLGNRYLNTETIRVIIACCLHKDLSVAGAASSGKTFPIAAFILEDWKSAPHATLSFVCTTSMAASEDRIWGAIVKCFQRSKHKVGTYIPHKSMIVWGKFTDDAQDREYNAAIKALAIPKGKEGQNAIDTTRGRKQTFIRLVFDELPEMDLYVTKAAVNLEANEELVMICIGNPSNPLDAHGQMCQPDHPLGFKSISKDIPEWKTRTGWCIFLNGEWSPNFQALVNESVPFRYLTSAEKLARMLVRCHGNKESLEYYRNAIGFWPGEGVSTTILTLELIQKNNCEKEIKWRATKRKRIAGFDTSFTTGGDLCVVQFGELGEDMSNRMRVEHIKEKVYMVPAFGVFEDELAKLVVDDLIEMGVEPDCFGMDISSDGGKVMRSIIRYWLEVKNEKRAAQVVPLSSLERPSERMVSNVDLRKCCDAYDRRVTEYWMTIREAVLCQVIGGMKIMDKMSNEISPLIRQLCTRTYGIKGKKVSIEPKDEMKERTLGVSPDHADAFAYMIEMARRHGLVLRTPSEEDEEDERREERREVSLNQQSGYGSYSSDDWGEDDSATGVAA